MQTSQDPYWYLASYPKSGNTWCRVFIVELRRLASLDPYVKTSAEKIDNGDLSLNQDLGTGAIVSSRIWIDDLLGVDSSDLFGFELDRVRGRLGYQHSLYAENLRYHKVHDAFRSPDSAGPVVSVKGCRGVVLLTRHPADVIVSLSHFFSWSIEKTLAFLLDENASLCERYPGSRFQVRQFMGTWSSHTKSWLDQKLIPLLHLRYEDLLLAPMHAFSRLARFLDLPSEPDLIKQAVINCSFTRLKALEEKEGGFHERADGCDRFFRSGRSGEGREVLSRDQYDCICQAFYEVLARLGYQDCRKQQS